MVWVCLIVIVAAVICVLTQVKKKKKQQSFTIVNNGEVIQGAVNMAQGIRAYNESGDLIFDMSSNTTYVLGTGQTGTSDGSLSKSSIVAGRTWVAITGTGVDNAEIPVFTVTSGKISWKFKRVTTLTNVANVTFMYGVY